MHPKDADGIANRSSVIWVYAVCPDLSVQKLRIIMIKRKVQRQCISVTFFLMSYFSQQFFKKKY